MLKECGMEQIARKDVPVPTWFAGTSSADSVDYWKEANDCVSNADGEGVYRQDKDSDAIQMLLPMRSSPPVSGTAFLR